MHRQRTSFDQDWFVHVGELALAPKTVTGKAATCGGFSDQTRSERTTTAASFPLEMFGEAAQVMHTRAEGMGSDWIPVDLPHDWRIARSPSSSHPCRPDYGLSWQGFLPVDIVYYRKVFQLSLPAQGKRWLLQFDGVMRDADFWVNGFWLGHHTSGYTGWTVDISDFLHDPQDGPNVVLVRTDIGQAEGWWYEGGGLYRHVWLLSVDEVRVDQDGIWVTTPRPSHETASVNIAIEIVNDSDRTRHPELRLTLLDPDSLVRATRSIALEIPALTSATRSGTFDLSDPQLWEVGAGRLYRVRVEVSEDGVARDIAEQSFGIREIGFTPKGALTVNGAVVRLYGANLHQDFAGVGVALPDRIAEYKLELLAEMGVNAVRSAHHPASEALLDHADRMGMLVIDENRLLSTAQPHLDDLVTMVRSHRNHPCIALWSLGNEEMNVEGTRRGARILQRLIGITKSLDATRPVSAGGVTHFSSSYYDALDVVGAHYRSAFNGLDATRALRPGKPLIEDEEGLFASVRGQYWLDTERAYGSAFGTIAETILAGSTMPTTMIMGFLAHIFGGPPSDDIAQVWSAVYDRDDVAGAFVWLGIDCLGEPVPALWPGVVSSYGARDLIGLPKDYYWLLRSIFRMDPLVHAFPHWTWPGRSGQLLPFGVYSNCEEVEVEVNGSLIRRDPVIDHAVRYPGGIEYRPGQLIVRGLRGEEVVAVHRQRTAGPAARMELVPDRTRIASDGQDLSVIRLRVLDAQGHFVPDAQPNVQFHVKGPGRIIGVGNGDPSSHEPHQSTRRTVFRGCAVALLQSTGREGALTVTATSTLPAASVTITASREVRSHHVHGAADEAGPEKLLDDDLAASAQD
jgi:beta-galactosidase